MPLRALVIVGLSITLLATAAFLAPGMLMPAHNFSQYPGFEEYFATNPLPVEPPGPADRTLLEKHKPHFYVSKGSSAPVNFYGDYIAQGELRDRQGALISRSVTREILNAHKDDPEVVFSHIRSGEADAPQPVVFAQLERRQVDIGEGPETFSFLTYHAAFRTSGLPAGLARWQSWLVSLVAEPADWHQLDHYTAATVVLDGKEQPMALMLQQHHYHRTYLFGEGARLARDGRAEIDIAIHSNELYPHLSGRNRHRAVRSFDSDSWAYMLGVTDSRLFAADDITDPAYRLDYRLDFPSPSDAFYTFKGFLGTRRILPGRDGPPGAVYRDMPEFLPVQRQIVLGYWREGNRNDITTLARAFSQENGYARFESVQSAVLQANILCLRRWREGCALH